jgi:hypothetical protein
MKCPVGTFPTYLNHLQAAVAQPTQGSKTGPNAHFFVRRVEKTTDNRTRCGRLVTQVADADSPVRSARRWPRRISPRPSRAGVNDYFGGK